MHLCLRNIAKITLRTKTLLDTCVKTVVDRSRSGTMQCWDDIGIMLSYSCPAECATCYVNSSPQRRGLLRPDDLRNILLELKKLGCSGRHLHFAGGEPFLAYEHLLECLNIAQQEGMLPIQKLETNCFWCTNDATTRQCFAEVKSFGINQLLISCDPFHQQYIPIENVRRACTIACEVFGSHAVLVREQCFLDTPVDINTLPDNKRAVAIGEVLRALPTRFVGRAARQLTQFVTRYPKEKFAGDHCAQPLLRSKKAHVDPHGNMYPFCCAGIRIGNMRNKPLSHIYKHFNTDLHPMFKALAERGPVFLVQEAIKHGFKEPAQGYASKCHVCYEIRCFFWEHGLYRDEVGPAEVYAE